MKNKVTVDASVYARNHGAQPRGRGSWAFVMGALDYDRVDELDEQGRKRVWFAPAPLTFAEAKKLALVEARARGVTVVGVGP